MISSTVTPVHREIVSMAIPSALSLAATSCAASLRPFSFPSSLPSSLPIFIPAANPSSYAGTVYFSRSSWVLIRGNSHIVTVSLSDKVNPSSRLSDCPSTGAFCHLLFFQFSYQFRFFFRQQYSAKILEFLTKIVLQFFIVVFVKTIRPEGLEHLAKAMAGRRKTLL